MRLDRNRPFAEVCGRPGIVYEQDGHNYRSDGSLADVAPAVVPPPAVPESLPPEPMVPIPFKRGPGRPAKHALQASTVFSRQFSGYEEVDEPLGISLPTRDVLKGYRDPQNADGSMLVMPSVWADGV